MCFCLTVLPFCTTFPVVLHYSAGNRSELFFNRDHFLYQSGILSPQEQQTTFVNVVSVQKILPIIRLMFSQTFVFLEPEKTRRRLSTSLMYLPHCKHNVFLEFGVHTELAIAKYIYEQKHVITVNLHGIFIQIDQKV